MFGVQYVTTIVVIKSDGIHITLLLEVLQRLFFFSSPTFSARATLAFAAFCILWELGFCCWSPPQLCPLDLFLWGTNKRVWVPDIFTAFGSFWAVYQYVIVHIMQSTIIISISCESQWQFRVSHTCYFGFIFLGCFAFLWSWFSICFLRHAE